MAMPGIALAVPLTGQMTRIIRTSMVEELDKDYVRTARGFGIPYGTVVARNVLRNALITPVTVLGLKFGYMIGGAVVLEVIFSLPGMGMAILLASPRTTSCSSRVSSSSLPSPSSSST